MQMIESLYFSHPFWVWMGVGAVLLVIELTTGSGWLLWASACAGLMALLMLTPIDIGWAGDIVAYAVLTIVATLISRRFMPGRAHHRPDINDRTRELLGKTGLAVGAFHGRAGRVLVDGSEWAAELDDGDPPAAGGKIEVVRV